MEVSLESVSFPESPDLLLSLASSLLGDTLLTSPDGLHRRVISGV